MRSLPRPIGTLLCGFLPPAIGSDGKVQRCADPARGSGGVCAGPVLRQVPIAVNSASRRYRGVAVRRACGFQEADDGACTLVARLLRATRSVGCGRNETTAPTHPPLSLLKPTLTRQRSVRCPTGVSCSGGIDGLSLRRPPGARALAQNATAPPPVDQRDQVDNHHHHGARRREPQAPQR